MALMIYRERVCKCCGRVPSLRAGALFSSPLVDTERLCRQCSDWAFDLWWRFYANNLVLR